MLFTITLILSVLFVGLGTGFAVISANNQVRSNSAAVHAQIAASCSFWDALGAFPITPVPPAKVPSEFGVKIVLSSLGAYNGFGCGTLEPTPELMKWARYYHLPVP